LPQIATPEKLASLLTSSNLTFSGCDVHIDDQANKCLSGVGSISFQNKEDLVATLRALENLSLEEKKLEQKI